MIRSKSKPKISLDIGSLTKNSTPSGASRAPSRASMAPPGVSQKVMPKTDIQAYLQNLKQKSLEISKEKPKNLDFKNEIQNPEVKNLPDLLREKVEKSFETRKKSLPFDDEAEFSSEFASGA